MHLRKFHPDDLEAVLQLFYETVHSVGAKYYNEAQVDAWAPKQIDNKDRWLQSLMRNLAYVVEHNNKIIAFGDMSLEGYVDRLFVDKNAQGAGASLLIFTQLEKDARTLGLKEMTGEASVILKPIAERRGFTVVAEQQKEIRGVILTNYKMRKEL